MIEHHVRHVTYFHAGPSFLMIFAWAVFAIFLVALLVAFLRPSSTAVMSGGGGGRPVVGSGGVVMTPGYIGGAYYGVGSIVAAELMLAEGLILGGAMAAGAGMGAAYGGGYGSGVDVTDDTYSTNDGGYDGPVDSGGYDAGGGGGGGDFGGC